MSENKSLRFFSGVLVVALGIVFTSQATVGPIQSGENLWCVNKRIGETVDVIEEKTCSILDIVVDLDDIINTLSGSNLESIIERLISITSFCDNIVVVMSIIDMLSNDVLHNLSTIEQMLEEVGSKVDACCEITNSNIEACCRELESKIDTCCNINASVVEACCNTTNSHIDACCDVTSSRIEACCRELESKIDICCNITVSCVDTCCDITNSHIDACCRNTNSNIDECCQLLESKIDKLQSSSDHMESKLCDLKSLVECIIQLIQTC